MNRIGILHLLRPTAGGMRSHLLTLLHHVDHQRLRVGVAGPLDDALVASLAGIGVAPRALAVPGRPSLALVGAASELSLLLAEQQPGVLHCHGLMAALVGRLAVGRMPVTRRRPALLATIHNLPTWPPSRLRLSLNRLAERRVTPPIDRYIAVSLAVRHALTQDVGISPERISVVYNGIDPRPYANRIPTRRTARHRLDVPHDADVVAVLARLAPEKGVDVLVRAVAEMVRRRGPAARPLHLLVAGEGQQRVRLTSLAGRLGVAAHVHLLGQQMDPLPVLRAADVVAAPSRAEGLGLACIEALAAGRPVVAAAVGGLPEVVRHNRDGLLVPANDPGALGRALDRLLADEVLRRRLAASGRRHVQRQFAADAMARHTVRLYEWLAGRAPGARAEDRP